MTLKIISPQEVLFDGEVTSVTLPGTEGEFTVLHNHAALLATLTAGSIRFKDAAGTESSLNTGAGVADIDNNVVTVCIY